MISMKPDYILLWCKKKVNGAKKPFTLLSIQEHLKFFGTLFIFIQ